MTVDQAREWIEEARRHNVQLRKEKRRKRRMEACVGFSVSLLYHYFFSKRNCALQERARREKEDYEQEARVWLWTKGKKVVAKWWKEKKPDAYLTTAIYRRLVRYASLNLSIGRYHKRRAVTFCIEQHDRSKYGQVESRRLQEEDVQTLIQKAPVRVKWYIAGRYQGQSDGAIQSWYEWTRTELERVRLAARQWFKGVLDVQTP